LGLTTPRARIPVQRLVWTPCYRIIPSRFPPIDLFERVTNAADLEAVLAVESLTNDRIRDEVGKLQLTPPEDRISGPGSSAIMAAFTHLNPEGSRFSDGSYGVFYAARDLDTAVEETKHHRSRFMLATKQPPMELDMRVYAVDLKGKLHDIRRMRNSLSRVYSRDRYASGQDLGRSLRDLGSLGIAYESVRRKGGECAAIFRPTALSNCRQERHLCYVWDGTKIATVYEKRSFGDAR
jgi:hypothetical protein